MKRRDQRKQRKQRKRLFAMLLAHVMAFTLVGYMPVAADSIQTGGYSEIISCTHTVHDDRCGYVETAEGSACNHEHDGDCYTQATDCRHIHTEECHGEEAGATPSNTSRPDNCPHIHDGDCGYEEAGDGLTRAYVLRTGAPQNVAPVITASVSGQPAELENGAVTVTKGKIVILSAGLETGSSDLSWKWERKRSSDTQFVAVPDATGPQLEISTSEYDSENNDIQYQCVAALSESDVRASEPVTITVASAYTASAALDSPVSFFVGLSAAIEAEYTCIKGEATVSIAELNPSWEVSTDNGQSWKAVSAAGDNWAADGATLSITSCQSAYNGYQVRFSFKTPDGFTVISNPATLEQGVIKVTANPVSTATGVYEMEAISGNFQEGTVLESGGYEPTQGDVQAAVGGWLSEASGETEGTVEKIDVWEGEIENIERHKALGYEDGELVTIKDAEYIASINSFNTYLVWIGGQPGKNAYADNIIAAELTWYEDNNLKYGRNYINANREKEGKCITIGGVSYQYGPEIPAFMKQYIYKDGEAAGYIVNRNNTVHFFPNMHPDKFDNPYLADYQALIANRIHPITTAYSQNLTPTYNGSPVSGTADVTLNASFNTNMTGTAVLAHKGASGYDIVFKKFSGNSVAVRGKDLTFSPYMLFIIGEPIPPIKSRVVEIPDTPAGNPNDSSSDGDSSSSDDSTYNPDILRGTWIRTDAGIWKFRLTSGAYAKSRWGLVDGLWYYFDGEGKMVTGWQFLNNRWYYLCTEETSKLAAGRKEGAMVTGWYYDPMYQSWFYLDASGAMVTGWKEIGGRWYYFHENGVMAADTEVDGYKLGPDGAWKE